MSPKDETQVKRETTSIKIRPDVWKQAKIDAIRLDMDLSELVEHAIQDWIKQEVPKRLKEQKNG
ncbi:MAG: hypothetical protein ACRD9Q_03390 [Nitrososphaeraceae archaeon]